MLSPSCSQCPAKLAKSNLASVPHPQGRSWGRSLYCDHHPLEPATLDKGSTVEKMRGTKVCESCWDGGKLCASADVLLLTRASTVSQNSSSLVHGPPGLDGGGHGVQSTYVTWNEKLWSHLSKVVTPSDELLFFGYCFKNTKPRGFWAQV